MVPKIINLLDQPTTMDKSFPTNLNPADQKIKSNEVNIFNTLQTDQHYNLQNIFSFVGNVYTKCAVVLFSSWPQHQVER